MKKISTIAIALVMVLAMSQCKKNEQNDSDNQGEAVTITLDVNGALTGSASDGAKVDVNTTTGTVNFEENDMIQVASGGKYVGTLSYDGTQFIGTISNAVEGYPLHFYFLGNVTPTETLVSGITESCSVVISDQTEHLPVISYAPSIENFGTTTNFTAQLLNKCALAKFNVTTSSETATCVTGFNNKVTVDFSENSVTSSQEGNGVITLPAGNGTKWAILLPQEALEEGEPGSAYSEDGIYDGKCGNVPAIGENYYLPLGISVSINHIVGTLNGVFTINSNGDRVSFSRGNLQYQASSHTWRFAENQWDFVGTQNPSPYVGTVAGSDNSMISPIYNGWIDLFGWGTSGYNHGAICYRPWNTSGNSEEYHAYGDSQYNLNDQTGQADWGYNAISNGGNQENQWRTLAFPEWYYLFFNRITMSGIRFAKAEVNNVNGVILLPDDWSSSIYSLNNTNNGNVSYNCNVISNSQWNILEDAGAIFLPSAGYRMGTTVYNVGDAGCYWSALHRDSYYAYVMYFSLGSSLANYDLRSSGFSVRLVRNIE